MSVVPLTAEMRWYRDKVRTAELLGIYGLVFIKTLPDMLQQWVLDSCASEPHRVDEYAFTLMSGLQDLGVEGVGNDVTVLRALPAVLRASNSVESDSLQERHAKAVAFLPRLSPSSDTHANDISTVDQVLIPALLGGTHVLQAEHAAEIKKHIYRDDEVSASKLLAVYGPRHEQSFACALPSGFDAEAVANRLRTVDHKTLYQAMCHMGCIGPSVYTHGGAPPVGFSTPLDVSIALTYAIRKDREYESQST
jgi:hypothetical protein